MSQMSGGSSTRNAGERSKTIITVATDSLQTHPMNTKVYGAVDWKKGNNKDFLASIQKHGVLQPLIYARLSFDDGESYGNYVVSGHRRHEAAKKLGFTKVPVQILGDTTGKFTTDALLGAELFLIESNRQRVKTGEQKAREFKELKRIEAALAKQRMESGKKADPAPNSTQGTKGKAAAKAAEAVGLGRTTAEKLEKLVDAADAGDPKAKEALEDIEAKKGRGVDTAFKNVFVPKPTEPLTPIPNAWDILVKDDRPERLGQVGKLVALFKNSDLRGVLGTSVVSEDGVDYADEDLCESDVMSFRPAEAYVTPIDLTDARKLVAQHHYSHLMPRHTKGALGLTLSTWRETKLAGAITFGWGTRPLHTIQKLFPSLGTQDYFELGKLCVSDEMPHGTASRFIVAALHMLHQSCPHIKLVFTWADGLRGKPGYVYQSANFLYGGCIWTDVYRNRQGLRIHPRQSGRPTWKQMKKLRLEQFFGKQFRYVRFLCDAREQKRLLAESTDAGFTWTNSGYPKAKDLEWKKRIAGRRHVPCEQPIFAGTYQRKVK